jgi:hypothetical protein
LSASQAKKADMLELPAPDAITAVDAAELPAVLALLADLEELKRDGIAAQLRAVAATLTGGEHRRLAAEAAAGDRLAKLAVTVLSAMAAAEGR